MYFKEYRPAFAFVYGNIILKARLTNFFVVVFFTKCVS